MKQYIKNLFGLDSLYDRKVGWGYLVDIILFTTLLAFAVYFFGNINANNNQRFFVYTVTAVFLAIYVTHYLIIILKAALVWGILRSREYIETKDDLMAANGKNVSKTVGSNMFSSALFEEIANRPHIKLISILENGNIYDIRYDIYKKTNFGNYKAKELYYTVIEYKLRRRLPNIIFDSKKAKGRQFSKVFIGAQNITLEGNFSDVFDVFMPKYYHVDSLSFITPEVMQAMLELPDRDFEIIDESLFCYAPLLNDVELDKNLLVFEKLYKTLDNNLNYYRDERLKYELGKARVTPFAEKLLVSPRKYVLSVMVCVVAALTAIFVSYNIDAIALGFWLTFFLMVAATRDIYKIVSILSKNKKIESEFKKSL